LIKILISLDIVVAPESTPMASARKREYQLVFKPVQTAVEDKIDVSIVVIVVVLNNFMLRCSLIYLVVNANNPKR
jgi:hypothetical protein